jgi:hypothetical protein
MAHSVQILLWKFISIIARTVCYDGLFKQHNSEESLIDKCIEIICCEHISKFVDYEKKNTLLKNRWLCLPPECMHDGGKGEVEEKASRGKLFGTSFICRLASMLI